MAVDYYRSRPSPLQLLGEGLASGAGSALGQQLGKGLGSLVGTGFEKLTSTSPAEGNINFWISQGFSPEEAAQLVQMPLQIQEQMLRQSGQRKRAEALAPAYSKLLGTEMPTKKESSEEAQEKTQEEAENDLIIKLLESGATERDFQELLKAQQAQKKLGLAEEKGEIARHGATKDYMNKVTDDYKSAREGLRRLKRMRELEKEGLAGPGEVTLKESLTEIPYLGKFMGGLTTLNPASQEFKSLQKDFLKEMKGIFGARIAISEMNQFLQSIPTLINTREGRERIYNNFEKIYKGQQAAFKEARKIKAEHGGKTPLDINEQVQERLDDELDKILETMDLGKSNKSDYIKKIGNKSVALASRLPEGKTATNKITGERLIVRNGKWEPL